MTPTVIADEVKADSGPTGSTWYRWFNPRTMRWWSARTAVPANPRLQAMIVSSNTYDGLRTAEDNASIELPEVRR